MLEQLDEAKHERDGLLIPGEAAVTAEFDQIIAANFEPTVNVSQVGGDASLIAQFDQMMAALDDVAANTNHEKLAQEKAESEELITAAIAEMGSILTYVDEEQARSLEDVRTEMKTFLAREDVRNNMYILDQAVMMMHQYCQHHGADTDAMFKGMESIFPQQGPHDHSKHAHDALQKSSSGNEYEWVRVDGKWVKKKKKKK